MDERGLEFDENTKINNSITHPNPSPSLEASKILQSSTKILKIKRICNIPMHIRNSNSND